MSYIYTDFSPKFRVIHLASIKVEPGYKIENLKTKKPDSISYINPEIFSCDYQSSIIDSVKQVDIELIALDKLPNDSAGIIDYINALIHNPTVSNEKNRERSILSLPAIHKMLLGTVPKWVRRSNIILPIYCLESDGSKKILMLRQYISGYWMLGFFKPKKRFLDDSCVAKISYSLIEE